MGSFAGKLRRRLFGLKLEETDFVRRGFRGATLGMQERLENIGSAFLAGYHTALELGMSPNLGSELDSRELELRGFSFEGAGMGLALLDCLTPWRFSRISAFLLGAGNAHAYMVHVGAGWVWGRVPSALRRNQECVDPLLHWLKFDGWGFHEGFFHWPKYIEGQARPKSLTGYGARAFDQGLGRSFWFVNGGNVELIWRTISNFTTDRQADLWSGIGLAATYAGISDETSLSVLRESTGSHWRHLAQGAAFAAKARQRAGNLTDYTDCASRILCGVSAPDAARLTDTALENLPSDASQPAYELWRRRIQSHFQNSPQLQEKQK